MNRKERRAAMIELPKTGATGQIIQKVFESVVQHHASEIALKSFIEGYERAGAIPEGLDWALDLTARLVPAQRSSPEPSTNGHQEQTQADLRETLRAHRDEDTPL